MNKAQFQKKIYAYFEQNKRDFPWRKTTNPYHVLVSEIMLQQTQTKRAAKKFPQFIKRFPTVKALANAEFKEVLSEWQGLGYNRRAKFLHDSAKQIIERHDGHVPNDVTLLDDLPGIGYHTARSIAAFAFNAPVAFIETNIRSVFIEFFFKDKKVVSDNELLPVVEQMLDEKNARTWYNALMDYGAMLKETSNPSKKSAQYTKQSKFEGSDRQIRGAVLRLLLKKQCDESEIHSELKEPISRVKKILDQLVAEEMIDKKAEKYVIK